jgi:hypothetical protein
MSHDQDTPPDDDVRCCCGSLVARIVPGGVELKCRRCHRLTVVPVPRDTVGTPVTLDHGSGG